MADAIVIGGRVHNLPESEPDRRGKIGEILNYLSKFAFESAVVQSLRIATGRKQEISKDEPFFIPFNGENEARHLKIVTEEMQARIEKMQEDMDGMRRPHKISANCTEKSAALEKVSDKSLQAKIEKMQEEMNDLMLQCKASAKCVEESGTPKKKPEDNGVKGLDHVQKNKKWVFIHSRL